MLYDVYLYRSRLILGEIGEGLVVVPANSEHVLWTVHIIAEVNIVNLISISFIHIKLQHQVHELIRGLDTKLC